MAIKVFISAALAEFKNAQHLASFLEDRDVEVVSTWHDSVNASSQEPEDRESRKKILFTNLKELQQADKVVIITIGSPRCALVEAGFALAWGKPIAYYGHVTNISDSHPNAQYVPASGSYYDLLEWLNNTKLPDSGARTQYSSGAVREPSGNKGRFDLVPPYPHLRLAKHYGNGAAKYDDRNWEKGLPLGRFIESLERHIQAFKDGERSEDHLSAALWNIYGYMHTERAISRGEVPANLWDVPWASSVPEWSKPDAESAKPAVNGTNGAPKLNGHALSATGGVVDAE